MTPMLSSARPRVLIVDDNPRVRALIRHLIQDVTSRIYECGDGHSAEAMYAAERPDWVLMDIAMPGPDGIAVTRRITGQYPDARIVILTDHDEASYRQAAADAGARAYVLKEDMAEIARLLCQDTPGA